ncbi:MerR family transcriptional regulator [Bacillus sp. JJ722]|uniref:MerR family transcriptional regulator n=1 Tax=Bacillus sp. JJ722 TaxID=3122973 RepID=UPI003000508A
MIAIQDVSKQTGISVRTLRYYEEIGLLFPSSKTEGGHRQYGEEELMKLQQIVFMKSLGFRLKEIQSMLNHNWDWSASLDHQLVFVLEEQEKLKQMESAIRSLKNVFSIEGELNEDLIQMMISLSNRDHDKKKAFRKGVFADDELDLVRSLPSLERNDPSSLEWLGLLGQLKQQMIYGADSDSVQRIIKRMMEKTADDYQDNDSFLEKMWEIRKSPQQSEQVGLYPLDEDFLHFLEQAYKIYETNQIEQKGVHDV